MNKTCRDFLALAWLSVFAAGTTHSAHTAAATEPILFGADGPTFWRLVSINDTPAGAVDSVVEIGSDTLFLSLPCEIVGYAISHGGSTLTVHNWYTGGNTCGGVKSGLLTSYETALKTASRYRLTGNELTLLDRDNRPAITFTRRTSNGIENRRWSIERFFDGASLVSIAEKFRNAPLAVRNNVIPPQVTLIHGKIYGTPGCGGFVGNYSLAAGRLKLEFGSLLTGYCSETAIEIERGVSPALRGDRIVRQEGEQIHLVDTAGRVQIVLVPWTLRGFR